MMASSLAIAEGVLATFGRTLGGVVLLVRDAPLPALQGNDGKPPMLWQTQFASVRSFQGIMLSVGAAVVAVLIAVSGEERRCFGWKQERSSRPDEASGEKPEAPALVHKAGGGRKRPGRASVRTRIRENSLERKKVEEKGGDDDARAALMALSEIPSRLRSLYLGPHRIQYDPRVYDFAGSVREMLGSSMLGECPLEQLHEVVWPATEDFFPIPLLEKALTLAGCKHPNSWPKKDRTRRWSSSASYRRWLELYWCFLREVVLPRFGEDDAVVQQPPTLRIVMPSRHAGTAEHTDAEYGHVAQELNFWMPLSRVAGRNFLYAESFPGRRDYRASRWTSPVEPNGGRVFGKKCYVRRVTR